MLSTKDVIQYLNQHGNVQAIEDMAAFFPLHRAPSATICVRFRTHIPPACRSAAAR